MVRPASCNMQDTSYVSVCDRASKATCAALALMSSQLPMYTAKVATCTIVLGEGVAAAESSGGGESVEEDGGVSCKI